MATQDIAPSRFRQWRTDAGLTLDDLADLTGRSKGYLSRIERGQRTPSPLVKVQLARSLGARVRDLFDVDPVRKAS
ncbi:MULTISPECIES: helix-turn-helix domain-containing protein [Protofrankia]|uniref:HTH cro/C1-type domain-containing protein n=1 Tax=Protofrankia coriariae TaxID=1562887 RepID=A0ABR5F268_9ACTN|nr:MULTISPECIES: helix-turn-helix transcriptional regulator [Protofrankia]KLL10807.1 hypothetical protein FrCorBMG51_15420 [Protofrankia coriariae]ONH34009.1 hypothetical protein BL254_18385 [Protofrankia sp. BMG5.30]